MSKRRTKRQFCQTDVSSCRIGVVTATIQQLAEIGIDEDIVGKEVKVYDIDKYGGMYPPCSRIVVDNQFEWLAKKGINADYIFPTRWLSLS
jgi:hypothetical protein